MTQVGIGLRQPHYEAFLARRPALGFVEVHSENFFADGGAALGVLDAVREHYPVSLHGVGLSLGAAALVGGIARVLLFALPLKLGLIAACLVGLLAGLLVQKGERLWGS